MKILITGICGFVGFRIASKWKESNPEIEIIGMDNLIRPGSELNRLPLKKMGVQLIHGDIRKTSDFESLPEVDWVLDCAANPSVLAGVDGKSSSRQVVEHNLVGTLELLEYCRRVKAGFILLSTSRVYGVEPLATLPMVSGKTRYELDVSQLKVNGVSNAGISESFPSDPPLSLYGTTKRSAELLALEYSAAFDFPVWINRCGVMAGPGQFGKADQGIISFWIHSYLKKNPLKYIGFAGSGHQVRDFFDPQDLVGLLQKQTQCSSNSVPKTINIGGGNKISASLLELTEWCEGRFGFSIDVESSPEVRPYDIPWVVMDGRRAEECWEWAPSTSKADILESIALHAENHPNWLDTVNS